LSWRKKLIRFFYNKRYNINPELKLIFRKNDVRHKFKKPIIREILKNDQKTSLSLKEIKKEYEKQDNSFDFSCTTLRNYLTRYNIALFKTPKFKTTKALTNKNLCQKSIYIKKITELMKIESHFIFFDESAFQNSKKQKKRWLLNNENHPISFPGQLQLVNMLAACDNTRMIHYELKDGTNNAETVISFLKTLLIKVEEDIFLNRKLKEGKIWVIIDNASIHTAKKTQKSLKELKMNFLFLPPYMPEFNTIEFVFGLLKNGFYKKVFNNR